MKFGKQLEEYELPEWKGHYIPYTSLKKIIEEMKGKGSVPGSEPDTPGGAAMPLPSLQRLSGAGTEVFGPSLDQWLAWLEKEAVRAGDFVDRGLHGLSTQLKDLEKMAESLSLYTSGDPESSKGPYAESGEDEWGELRVLEALGRVAEGINRLRGFAELNHAALYKILKKHDKLVGSKEGLSRIFPKLVADTKLGDTQRMNSLDAELKRLYLRSSLAEGLGAGTSPEVARLCAGLGRSHAAAFSGQVARSLDHRHELLLSFFAGSSIALLLSIFVLLCLPARDRHTFSEAYFLTPFPVFRVVFYLVLILWCMGAVASVCDKWDINHMFILNVDPRCRVSPDFFFARAALLTTLWILVFGLYVIDYKWRILPEIGAIKGSRTSMHYVLYPLALLFLAVLGMLWPSSICRNRYKASVLRAVGRCASAPRHPVDFCDNIVGDVLTSLAKPLQDLPPAVCYLISEHPQAENSVKRFIHKGDTCHHDTHHLILPLIAGMPYFWRAMQCLRRWRDTMESRHLFNFGKYCSSLLVVPVTYAHLDVRTVVAVSLFATVYAGAWDVTMDWGLGMREFLGSTVAQTSRSSSAGRSEIGGAGNRTTSRAEISPTTRSGHVKPVRVDRPDRHFPKRVYWACCLIDIIARFSWVVTLMPISILTPNISYRVLLVMVISSVEIVRRGIWAILRIEYEQIANASGFRALLWVPSKLNTSDKQRGSVRRSTTGVGADSMLKTPLLEQSH